MAKKKDIETEELQALLSDVRKEIAGLLKSEEQELSKTHPGEETSSEVTPDESSTAPADESPSEDSGATSSPPDASPEGTPPPDMDASAGAPPSDGAPTDGDPGADQSADPQALQAEYAKLPIEALKAHYLAAKEALFAMMGTPGGDAGAPPAPGMDASAGAPPPPAPAMPPAASPDAPPALKGELKPDYDTTGSLDRVKSGGVAKSEARIADLEAQLVKATGAIEKMVTFVEKIATTPVRKAVTSIADLDNSAGKKAVGQLTKAEIKTRLKRAAEKQLAKSDRELINSYDLGIVDAKAIAHLIEQ